MARWTTCSAKERYTNVPQTMTMYCQRGEKVELLLEEYRYLVSSDGGGGRRKEGSCVVPSASSVSLQSTIFNFTIILPIIFLSLFVP
jgi:hypothetical protein